MPSSVSPLLIDVHHHIFPAEYLSIVGDRLGPQTLAATPIVWSPQISLDVMDKHGISAAVVSLPPPGFWFGDLDETRKLVRVWNNFAAGMQRDFPMRFGFFAALPLPNVDSTLKEIEYALDTLKADGVMMLTNYDGKYPGDTDFAPVFDELSRRKTVVFFHPDAPPGAPKLENIPYASLEFTFDTTRAIASLLYTGTLARCRGARYVFSHAGGTLPFLAERIARLMVKPQLRPMVPDGVLPELQRLYYDTAVSVNPRTFASLLSLVKPSNVLFGSDYPNAGEPTVANTVRDLPQIGLSPADLTAIQSQSALALLQGLAKRLQ